MSSRLNRLRSSSSGWEIGYRLRMSRKACELGKLLCIPDVFLESEADQAVLIGTLSAIAQGVSQADHGVGQTTRS